MNNYITPPNHFAFLAKELFSNIGEVKWGALAHLDKNGGGPIGDHTHEDNHMFIVVEGEAKVRINNDEKIISKNGCLFVDGMIPHSIWNNISEQTTVIKLNLKR